MNPKQETKRTFPTFPGGPVVLWPNALTGAAEIQTIRRGDLMLKEDAARIIARCQARQIAAELEAEQADAGWRESERRARQERDARCELAATHEGRPFLPPFPEPLPRIPYADRDGVGESLLGTLRAYATDNVHMRLELGKALRDADDATADQAEAMRRLDIAERLRVGFWCGTEDEPRFFGKVRAIDAGFIVVGLWPWRQKLSFRQIRRVTNGYVIMERNVR